MKTHNDNINLLIERLSNHSDERALDQLFHIYYEKLLSSAFFVVRSKDLAEEIVADVFYRLWQNREKLIEIKNLDNYLFISIRNQSLNYLAKEQRGGRGSLDEVPADTFVESHTAEDMMLAGELHDKITESIDNLPPKCKEIFQLIRFEGLKYKEVAEKLNVSVNTVDAQMGIAIRKLSDAIGYIAKCSGKRRKNL